MDTLISKIGLGTVQFGIDYGISNVYGKTTRNEVGEIIKHARNSGIQYIDTAFAYGDAEIALGGHDLSRFKVVSKYIPNGTSVVEQFHTSLHRLGIGSFYGYLAHRPLDLVKNEKKNWQILLELKSNNKVERIGASFNSAEELNAVLDSGIELDIVQIPYNYLDRRFESLAKYLRSRNCEVHTRSAFLQGLFFCSPDSLNAFFDEVKPLLKQVQTQPNLSGQLLRFVLEKEFIDITNIGINNLKQLKENLKNIGNTDVCLPELRQTVSSQILMPSEWPQEN